jgi:hypothetical protein
VRWFDSGRGHQRNRFSWAVLVLVRAARSPFVSRTCPETGRRRGRVSASDTRRLSRWAASCCGRALPPRGRSAAPTGPAPTSAIPRRRACCGGRGRGGGRRPRPAGATSKLAETEAGEGGDPDAASWSFSGGAGERLHLDRGENGELAGAPFRLPVNERGRIRLVPVDALRLRGCRVGARGAC